MRLICPHCGAEGTMDDSYRGKMVRCPSCGTGFGVFPWRRVPETESAGRDIDRGANGEQDLLSDLSAASSSVRPVFSVTSLIRDSWRETRGAKASLWAEIAVIYLVMLLAEAAVSFFLPSCGVAQAVAAFTSGACTLLQLAISLLSAILTAGLLYTGMKKVAGEPVSWTMVFKGWSFAGQIVLATILQTILVAIGFLLLVFPGVYLAVGYSLTLPLIMARKMSAWEAMEASRKAVHKVWWQVSGLFGLMGLISFISFIPLGLGLIWTVPMFIILVSVLYHRLFGTGSNIAFLLEEKWEL